MVELRHPAAHPDGEMTMRGSLALRCVGAALGIFLAAVTAMAYDPDPPRDPRAEGLRPISASTLGDEIVRVDRDPEGTPRRCVRAARLETPTDGGPSRLEFGVERGRSNPTDAPGVTMFFRVQYLDRPNGKPLPVRDPVLEIGFFGPTLDWRLESMGGGWIRRSKASAQSSEPERGWFTNEIRKPGNAIVSTFPDGTHRMHHLRGGVSPWHFEMFFDCVCKLLVGLPKSMIDGFPCPELRRN
jgi:hypothetical protein